MYDRSAKLVAKGVAIEYWLQRSRALFTAVQGVDLAVRTGEFVAIVGPSGCGKTTFLNAVDGLLPIAGGSLTLDGREITEPGADRAMVFQQPGLLPWRTVLGNVIRKSAVSRFTRTLGTMISSGVSILEGLEITAKTSGNRVVMDAIMESRASIAGGDTISAPLRTESRIVSSVAMAASDQSALNSRATLVPATKASARHMTRGPMRKPPSSSRRR